MFLYTLGFFVCAIVALVFKLIGKKSERGKKIYNYISKKILVSSVLIFLQESYLEFSITSIINLTRLSWNNYT